MSPCFRNWEMAHKVIVPKKIMAHSFLNSRTLVILCLFATMGTQFYSLIQAIMRKMQIFECLIQAIIRKMQIFKCWMSFCNHGPSILELSLCPCPSAGMLYVPSAALPLSICRHAVWSISCPASVHLPVCCMIHLLPCLCPSAGMLNDPSPTLPLYMYI